MPVAASLPRDCLYIYTDKPILPPRAGGAARYTEKRKPRATGYQYT
ncbi:hypothetical protein PPRY_a3216 [Pseudoalteromonas prydzensis ACAM 620]|nr:hypothetical protein [Pseudoalteromonas prydzensis ACAM 620]